MKHPASSTLIGQRFGRLIVQAIHQRGHALDLSCLCDCGNTTIATKYRLLIGRTKSCGCLRQAGTGACQRSHGRTGTTEYCIYRSLLQRCYDQNSHAYFRYGARGITVCDRWRDSFENFYADMGPRPEGMTIERLDNNGNYEPCNCEWRSRKAQANNRRSSVFLTHDGRTMTAAQWSDETGLSQKIIHARIRRAHWPVSIALTTPVVPGQKIKWALQAASPN